MRNGEKAAGRSGWRSVVMLLAAFGTLFFAVGNRLAIASDRTLLAQLVDDEDEAAGSADEDQRLQGKPLEADPLEAQPLEAQPWQGKRIDEMDSGDTIGAGAADEVRQGATGKAEEGEEADETGEAGANERPARQPPAEFPPPVCMAGKAQCTVGGSPPCCSGMCLNGRCAF